MEPTQETTLPTETTAEVVETTPETVETAPETAPVEPEVTPEVAEISVEPTPELVAQPEIDPAATLEAAKAYHEATGTPMGEAERLANVAAMAGEELTVPAEPSQDSVGKEYTQNGIKYRRVLNENGHVVDIKI